MKRSKYLKNIKYGVCWHCGKPLTKKDSSTTHHDKCVEFKSESVKE